MNPMNLLVNIAAAVGLTFLLTTGWHYARHLHEKRKARADRPSQNTMQVECGGCGDVFPVEYHAHQIKQGRTVVGRVVHVSKADVELHGLTCKGNA